jgi:hypothetical protein
MPMPGARGFRCVCQTHLFWFALMPPSGTSDGRSLCGVGDCPAVEMFRLRTAGVG